VDRVVAFHPRGLGSNPIQGMKNILKKGVCTLARKYSKIPIKNGPRAHYVTFFSAPAPPGGRYGPDPVFRPLNRAKSIFGPADKIVVGTNFLCYHLK